MPDTSSPRHTLLERILGGSLRTPDLAELAARTSAIAAEGISAAVSRPALKDYAAHLGTRPLGPVIQEMLLPSLARLVAAGVPEDFSEENQRLAWGAALGAVVVGYPEWVLPFGFDEVRYGAEPIYDPTLSQEARGAFDERQAEMRQSAASVGIDLEVVHLLSLIETLAWKSTQYRTPDGVWHDCEGVLDKIVPAEGSSFRDFARGVRENWLAKALSGDLLSPSAVTFPGLVLQHASRADTPVHVVTRKILQQVRDENVSLRSIHWRTLEELVAELLRSMGLQVIVTPRSGDGGRDVVARGELIPGEPTIFAVEVKQKPVVGLGDLRGALWANRHFPALLLATSGRFSAGVYRERREGAAGLRLFLKDGVALRQWIDHYVRSLAGDRGPSRF